MKNSNYFIPTEDNKHHVADYPYGYRKRCEMFYWVEWNNKGECRWVRQSKYDGYLNKPKKSTYYKFILAHLNDEGHIKYSAMHPSSVYDKETMAKWVEILESLEIDLPEPYQKAIDKFNGVAVEEVVSVKFGKIDKNFCSVPVQKVTFDGDNVKYTRMFEAINSQEEKIFSIGGGYRVFLKSEEIGFLDKEIFDSWVAAFNTIVDPFAEEEEEEEEEKKPLRLKKKVKKEMPLSTATNTRKFNRKELYKWKRWTNSNEKLMKFMSDPYRNAYRHEYKFKDSQWARCDGEFFMYPYINEEGILINKRPEEGYILQNGENFMSYRWRKTINTTRQIDESYVFLSEADAKKFIKTYQVEDFEIVAYSKVEELV